MYKINQIGYNNLDKSVQKNGIESLLSGYDTMGACVRQGFIGKRYLIEPGYQIDPTEAWKW